MKRAFLMLVAGIGLIVLSAAVPAGSETIGASVLEKTSEQGIRFMSGGVGLEERTAMDQARPNYNLKLVFAVVEGNYLSYVDVTIQDQAGKVILNAGADGPWFLVSLPNGAYNVTVSHSGMKKSQKVQVDRTQKRILFHWRS